MSYTVVESCNLSKIVVKRWRNLRVIRDIHWGGRQYQRETVWGRGEKRGIQILVGFWQLWRSLIEARQGSRRLTEEQRRHEGVLIKVIFSASLMTVSLDSISFPLASSVNLQFYWPPRIFSCTPLVSLNLHMRKLNVTYHVPVYSGYRMSATQF